MKDNGLRCVDTLHAYLVKDAEYDGEIEIPIIKSTNKLPSRLISFSEAMCTNNFDRWVHFYENDNKFERVWNTPRKYLHKLKKFLGVITPDFSLYRDMPLSMQIWNTYRGKALGHWLQSEGLNVLPNVRYGDERTYSFCCNAVPANAYNMHQPIRESQRLYKQDVSQAGAGVRNSTSQTFMYSSIRRST